MFVDKLRHYVFLFNIMVFVVCYYFLIPYVVLSIKFYKCMIVHNKTTQLSDDNELISEFKHHYSFSSHVRSTYL